ncbi:MAG TPA: tetratricopeptide repeat protein [Candidatus Baltobacteraceae bacterium]|jgi:Flp pilus assembly protein TadD|nr:tetratricopeptide repeat protein [Candidatus Baltobacteraceae bacterium]
MRCSGLALTVLLFASAASNAAAQTYGQPTPAPRTNDLQQLRADANAREVHERFTLGLDAEAHMRWDSAAAEFARIVQLRPPEPQNSTAHYDLGIAYSNLSRNDDAAREFRGALQGDPQFLAAMANLIAVDLSRGDLHEARVIADRFSASAPDSARAMYSRGIVAFRSGDYATAKAEFSRLISADAAYAVAHYDLGIAQAALGELDAASQEFALALDLAPGYARARFALGTVLLREGKRTEARAAFDRAAGDAANDPALHNLAASLRDAIHTR